MKISNIILYLFNLNSCRLFFCVFWFKFLDLFLSFLLHCFSYLNPSLISQSTREPHSVLWTYKLLLLFFYSFLITLSAVSKLFSILSKLCNTFWAVGVLFFFFRFKENLKTFLVFSYIYLQVQRARPQRDREGGFLYLMFFSCYARVRWSLNNCKQKRLVNRIYGLSLSIN